MSIGPKLSSVHAPRPFLTGTVLSIPLGTLDSVPPLLARRLLLDVASTTGLVPSLKERIVVLSMKELNRNDFHECLKPIVCSKL